MLNTIFLALMKLFLKVIEAEFDKKSGKEIDGLLALTDDRFLFISKKMNIILSITLTLMI
ncbi:hypothetical protein GCM10020331_073940 [Ectobacillus funiculus]